MNAVKATALVLSFTFFSGGGVAEASRRPSHRCTTPGSLRLSPAQRAARQREEARRRQLAALAEARRREAAQVLYHRSFRDGCNGNHLTIRRKTVRVVTVQQVTPQRLAGYRDGAHLIATVEGHQVSVMVRNRKITNVRVVSRSGQGLQVDACRGSVQTGRRVEQRVVFDCYVKDLRGSVRCTFPASYVAPDVALPPPSGPGPVEWRGGN
jgi:hypothetical protein